MTIIFGIVFLIIILSIASSQNSRITRMEKMLQNLTIIQNVQSPINTQVLEKIPVSPLQDLITDNPTLEIPKQNYDRCNCRNDFIWYWSVFKERI